MIPVVAKGLAISIKTQTDAIIAKIEAGDQPGAEAAAVAMADEYAKLVAAVSKP